jgi:predicted ribosomally synthesized peptide with SipW-like signal peptide
LKKLLISLITIGVVGAIAFIGTNAFFSDEETSTGNTFQTGAIDLKIDHTLASYNDFDCHTCSVVLVSDPTNMIIKKNGTVIDPFAAVYAWVHPAWTAQNDTSLIAANAKWIWSSNPTSAEDASLGVTYTFEKTFDWQGPAISSDLWFAVGSDNSVEVWLNGAKIGENLGEFGYRQESMLQIPAGTLLSHIIQGQNKLDFIVTNFPRPGQDGSQNPGGLIYKFAIDGKCTDNYFLTNCRLWNEKDLGTGDIVYNFNDVKPGDHGHDVISLDPVDNSAWACMTVKGTDQENTWTEPEKLAGDTSEYVGELSSHLQLFVWNDNGDGIYQPSETTMFTGTMATYLSLPIAEPSGTPLPGGQAKYLGLAWCFGAQSVDPGTGVISCDGTGETNITQTDSFVADLVFYSEQSRNNPNFSCQRINK